MVHDARSREPKRLVVAEPLAGCDAFYQRRRCAQQAGVEQQLVGLAEIAYQHVEVAVPIRRPDGTVSMLTAARLQDGRVADGPGADRLADVLGRA